MKTSEIIKEIERLPIRKRIYVIEKTIHAIGKHEDNNLLSKAANALYADYSSDKELTAFTNLDFETFYETR
jgi:hypothetical protein